MKQIDKDLIVSETELAWVSESDFTIDSWETGEKYGDIVAEIITNTICNLYRRKYIHVETKVEEYQTLFKIITFREIFFFISLLKYPNKNFTIGWLEEKIVDTLNQDSESHRLLDDLINEIFNDVFKNKKFINPAKEFIIKALAKQNCKYYNFEFYDEEFWIFTIKKIRIWRIVDQKELYEGINIKDFGANLPPDDQLVLKRRIGRMLRKYQKSDD